MIELTLKQIAEIVDGEVINSDGKQITSATKFLLDIV